MTADVGWLHGSVLHDVHLVLNAKAVSGWFASLVEILAGAFLILSQWDLNGIREIILPGLLDFHVLRVPHLVGLELQSRSPLLRGRQEVLTKLD